jgi:SNF family Na+-dependent transporter
MMVGPLVGCMFLSYVFTYFSVWKGLKSTGKMVYVTCLLPYLILTILFIKGLTLDGCGKGLEALFNPDWKYLGDISVWKSAASQILFSSGVSYGPLMYYGTGREKNHKLLTISYMIPAINSLTSFYSALTIFVFLGHVSSARCVYPVDTKSVLYNKGG